MPDISTGPFDHRILTGVVNKRPLKSDLFATFFKRRPPSNGENFELHIKTRNISMLPAITNHAPGTMRKGDKIEAGIVKAPRFRPKRVFMAAEQFVQPAGVSPYSPLENALAIAIAEDMDLHREELDMALEIMCQQAMVDGEVTLYDVVEGGKPVPRFTVNFQRPSSHRVALSGGALWSASGSDLQGQVEDWNTRIQEETGYGASDLLLGKNAWKFFRKHADVKDDLDNRGIDIGHLSPRVGRKLKGHWNGLNIWLVTGEYTDLDGTVKSNLDPDCALLVAADAESVIEFGKPVDIACTGPVEIFTKAFEQDDPSGIFTIAESRPLPWPKQPGWTVLAKVVGG